MAKKYVDLIHEVRPKNTSLNVGKNFVFSFSFIDLIWPDDFDWCKPTNISLSQADLDNVNLYYFTDIGSAFQSFLQENTEPQFSIRRQDQSEWYDITDYEFNFEYVTHRELQYPSLKLTSPTNSVVGEPDDNIIQCYHDFKFYFSLESLLQKYGYNNKFNSLENCDYDINTRVNGYYHPGFKHGYKYYIKFKEYKILDGSVFYGPFSDIYTQTSPKLIQPSDEFYIPEFVTCITIDDYGYLNGHTTTGDTTSRGICGSYGNAADKDIVTIPDSLIPDVEDGVVISGPCQPKILTWDVSTSPNIEVIDNVVKLKLTETALCPNIKYKLNVLDGSIVAKNKNPVKVPEITFKTGD